MDTVSSRSRRITARYRERTKHTKSTAVLCQVKGKIYSLAISSASPEGPAFLLSCILRAFSHRILLFAPLSPSQRVSYASHTCGVVVGQSGSSTQMSAHSRYSLSKPLSKKEHDTCMNPLHESNPAIVQGSARAGGMCWVLPRTLYRIGTCVWNLSSFRLLQKLPECPSNRC